MVFLIACSKLPCFTFREAFSFFSPFFLRKGTFPPALSCGKRDSVGYSRLCTCFLLDSDGSQTWFLHLSFLLLFFSSGVDCTARRFLFSPFTTRQGPCSRRPLLCLSLFMLLLVRGHACCLPSFRQDVGMRADFSPSSEGHSEIRRRSRLSRSLYLFFFLRNLMENRIGSVLSPPSLSFPLWDGAKLREVGSLFPVGPDYFPTCSELH